MTAVENLRDELVEPDDVARAILYAGQGEDFASAARRAALATRDALNAAIRAVR